MCGNLLLKRETKKALHICFERPEGAVKEWGGGGINLYGKKQRVLHVSIYGVQCHRVAEQYQLILLC